MPVRQELRNTFDVFRDIHFCILLHFLSTVPRYKKCARSWNRAALLEYETAANIAQSGFAAAGILKCVNLPRGHYMDSDNKFLYIG
jgi:hypothetical protein